VAQSGSNCSRVPSSWSFGGNHRKEPERPSALGADQGSDSECQVSSGCSGEGMSSFRCWSVCANGSMHDRTAVLEPWI